MPNNIPDTRIPLYAYAGQQDAVADGNPILLKSNRMGGLVTVDQILQWAVEGHTYHAQQGDAGTKLDFAETAYDEDQPQFALRIPTGTVVIPLSLVNTFQDMAGTDTQVIWSVTTNDIGNGTSTAATISNMRPDMSTSSACTARSLYTANATAATGLFEFARFLDAFADAATGPHPRFEWNIRTAAAIPVLKGPATLQMHTFATTDGPEGFGEYTWVELDVAKLVGV